MNISSTLLKLAAHEFGFGRAVPGVTSGATFSPNLDAGMAELGRRSKHALGVFRVGKTAGDDEPYDPSKSTYQPPTAQPTYMPAGGKAPPHVTQAGSKPIRKSGPNSYTTDPAPAPASSAGAAQIAPRNVPATPAGHAVGGGAKGFQRGQARLGAGAGAAAGSVASPWATTRNRMGNVLVEPRLFKGASLLASAAKLAAAAVSGDVKKYLDAKEVKQYGAYRSQALAGVPAAEAAIAGIRKVKAEHPGQYYLNPLVPGPITHGVSLLGRRVAATMANAPLRSALTVGGLSAAGGIAGNLIGREMMGSADAALGQAGGQIGGTLLGLGALAAIGNKKRQQHGRELYSKILKKYED